MVEIKSDRPVAVDQGSAPDEFSTLAAPEAGAHDRLGVADIGAVAIGGELLRGALSAGTESSAYGRNFGKVSAASFASAPSEPGVVEDDPSQVVEMGRAPRIAHYANDDFGPARRSVINDGNVSTLIRKGSEGWASLN